jgi:rhodanese-related sulfurtransferase
VDRQREDDGVINPVEVLRPDVLLQVVPDLVRPSARHAATRKPDSTPYELMMCQSAPLLAGTSADPMLHVTASNRFTINDLLAEARLQLTRVTPHEAQTLVLGGGLILDTRQDTDRWANGVIDGAVHAPRTVLEWVVDPASGHQDSSVTALDQPLVVMCNEGYSSSLAAHTLQRLGFCRATDMIGGFAAWQSAGLPISHTQPLEGSR